MIALVKKTCLPRRSFEHLPCLVDLLSGNTQRFNLLFQFPPLRQPTFLEFFIERKVERNPKKGLCLCAFHVTDIQYPTPSLRQTQFTPAPFFHQIEYTRRRCFKSECPAPMSAAEILGKVVKVAGTIAAAIENCLSYFGSSI